MTDLPTEGPAAPPRRNGELVFEEPWESRAFGMAVSLCERGHFVWDEFRAYLIAAIAEREDSRESWSYYACWLAALERLLAEKAVLPREQLEARTRELADRPEGHDH